jgi:hypothetical protein
LLVSLLAFLLSTSVAAGPRAGPLGFQKVDAPLVSPSEAQQFYGRAATLGVSAPAVSTEATPEIRALARGLKYDPDLIYQHVHDYIEYAPMFGSAKGAAGALLDENGNAFDQASLMIALLRESGYTASFVYGMITLNAQQITNWLGTSNDPLVVHNLLAVSGIPATVYTSGGALSDVDLAHVWVKVNIGGTDYVFDPSFKTHTYKSAIDLASAMGYDQASFLAGALTGTTVDPDFIQNVNTANVAGLLTTYASNLVNHIKANHPAATLDDILGGRTIDPVQNYPRQPSLPYQQAVLAEWSEIPAEYKASLRIEHLGIDQTLNTSDLYSISGGLNGGYCSIEGYVVPQNATESGDPGTRVLTIARVRKIDRSNRCKWRAKPGTDHGFRGFRV